MSRIAELSTQCHPSSWELPSSTVPTALNRPKSPLRQLFIVNSGLKRLSITMVAIAQLEGGYYDQYEPSTRWERGYIYGMSL